MALSGTVGPALWVRRKSSYLKGKAEDGAKGWMARAGVTNGFAADTVLLGREGEGCERSSLQIREGAVSNVEVAATNPQANVLETEEIVGSRLGAAGIFARALKKIKGNSETVGGGQQGDKRGRGMRELHGATHNTHGEWLDSCRRGVGLFPCLVQGGKAKIDHAKLVQARVRGPHPGERLPHASYGVLHRARTDRSPTASQAAVSITVGKQLEKRYLVAGDRRE